MRILSVLLATLLIPIVLSANEEYDQSDDPNYREKVREKVNKMKGIKSLSVRELPFLKFASQQTKSDVKEIMMENQLTAQEKIELIGEIVSRDIGRVQEDFERYQSALISRRQERERIHSEAISMMSPEAREVDSLIDDIMKNYELTPAEKSKLVREVFENLERSIRNEINDAYRTMRMAHRKTLSLRPPIFSNRLPPNFNAALEDDERVEVKSIQSDPKGDVLQFRNRR